MDLIDTVTIVKVRNEHSGFCSICGQSVNNCIAINFKRGIRINTSISDKVHKKCFDELVMNYIQNKEQIEKEIMVHNL